MLTSGLVITFSSDPSLAGQAMAELLRDGSLLLGDRKGRQCPLVIESPGPDEARDTHNWVSELTGIESAEVVFVDWESDEAEAENASA